MKILDQQLALLREASVHIASSDVAPYFKLVELQGSTNEEDQQEFRKLFSRFYGLNSGGLSEPFKKRYFVLLRSTKFATDAEPPYWDLLLDLYQYKRRQGDRVLAVSFVSKLIAMIDDSRPLYDIHVRNFFGLSKPGLGSLDFQIAGFINNIGIVRTQYEIWGRHPIFMQLLKPLIKKIPCLEVCHVNRICDFLVWTAGRKKLGTDKAVRAV